MLLHAFGLIPDQRKTSLMARASIAEAIATQVVRDIEAGRSEVVRATMKIIRKNNASVISLGVRRADGSLVVVSGEHPKD